MTSLWLANRGQAPWVAGNLDSEQSADVVVAGAGITGLDDRGVAGACGQERAGARGAHCRRCATGNTTAKISLLQGTHLSKIIAAARRRDGEGLRRRQPRGAGVAGSPLRGEWGGCAARRRLHLRADRQGGAVGARRIDGVRVPSGLNAKWDDDADVPFSYHGGVRLPDQAQFDPMPFLDSLGGRTARARRAARRARAGAQRVEPRRRADAACQWPR